MRRVRRGRQYFHHTMTRPSLFRQSGSSANEYPGILPKGDVGAFYLIGPVAGTRYPGIARTFRGRIWPNTHSWAQVAPHGRHQYSLAKSPRRRPWRGQKSAVLSVWKLREIPPASALEILCTCILVRSMTPRPQRTRKRLPDGEFQPRDAIVVKNHVSEPSVGPVAYRPLVRSV